MSDLPLESVLESAMKERVFKDSVVLELMNQLQDAQGKLRRQRKRNDELVSRNRKLIVENNRLKAQLDPSINQKFASLAAVRS